MMTLLSFFFLPHRSLLLFLLLFVAHLTNGTERTRKADTGTLEQIRKLINQKAQRDFVQNDAPMGAVEDALPRRNPDAKRHHDELAVNDPDGAYLQGDVELAEWQAERLEHTLREQAEDGKSNGGRWKIRKKRKIGREPFYKRWDKRRPISFDMADNVPELTRQKIRHALADWASKTCLRFREGGPDVDRLEFFDGGGCSSFVGRAGGTQGISIASPGCAFPGIIAHEIGHALGTFHEQARPDQPRHISVHYGNIPATRWNNFQPIGEDQATTFELPYDPGSVMHYGPYGFAADPFRPSISTLDRHWQSTIGQRQGPSFLDIQAINQAYQCAEHCFPPPDCAHGGYPDSNECARCVCPPGFAGKRCTEVQPSQCGGTIQVSPHRSRLISSPAHPAAPFPAGVHCFWLLRAPPGGHVLLQFNGDAPFGYPCEDTCDRAFVELNTGADFRVTGYRFCCASAPSATFRSAGSEMLVIHFAGATENGAQPQRGAGFRASVWGDREWPKPEAETRITTTTESGKMPESTVTGEQPGSSSTTAASSTTTFGMTTTTMATTTTEATTTATDHPGAQSIIIPSSTTSSSSSSSLPSPPPPPSSAECHCQEWSEWTPCSQMCGGCGRRARRRDCVSASGAAASALLCQTEERRMCGQQACPAGTNFLFNNGEFHLLWRGCCIGMFVRNTTASDGTPIGECGPLENNENAFLRIISSLLTAQDAKQRRAMGNSTIEKDENEILGRRKTGEH